MYLNEKEAMRELVLRRNDRNLGKRVRDFLGELPTNFPEEPFAGILVPVASTTLYEVNFKERVEALGLRPVWLEYLDDVLIPENPDKIYFGRATVTRLINFGLIVPPSLSQAIDSTVTFPY